MFFRRAFANKQQNLKNSNEYGTESYDETSSNEAADFRHWQMKVQQQQHQEQVRNSQHNQHNGHSVHHNQINYAPHHQTQQVLNGNYQNHCGPQINGNPHQFNNQTCVNNVNVQNTQPQHCSARRNSLGEKEKQLKTSAINCGGGLR